MSFQGCNIHINYGCELAIRRTLICLILLMLVNIIIFSNELWWLFSSASVMWVSGYQNHFSRKFPTDQKCLWGLAELLHFQDVIYFFSRLISLRKEWHWGRKSGFCSQLCACLFSMWPWGSGFASVPQGTKRGSGFKRGAGALKCPQNLATGNPAVCCRQQTFLCSAVQRVNTGRKK